MSLLESIAALITLTAIAAYAHFRFLKLPMTIGLMAIAVAISVLLLSLGALGFGIQRLVEGILREMDFNNALLNGMLSFLLFAGALHAKLDDLRANWARAGP
ncbi:MAG: cation:proton antiporter [Chitinophagaceae bacterium]|nr:cation:proton antiporter [Oligoflexus sp.]